MDQPGGAGDRGRQGRPPPGEVSAAEGPLPPRPQGASPLEPQEGNATMKLSQFTLFALAAGSGPLCIDVPEPSPFPYPEPEPPIVWRIQPVVITRLGEPALSPARMARLFSVADYHLQSIGVQMDIAPAELR